MGHIHILGEGGSIFKMDLPLHEVIEEKLRKGYLRRVHPDGEPYVEDAEEPVAATLPGSRPAVNAPKVDWVGWAVANGAKPDDAEAMTKQDLIDKFGAGPTLVVPPVEPPAGDQPPAPAQV